MKKELFNLSFVCFGSFATILKDAIPSLRKEDFVDLLFDGICTTSIDKSDKYKLLNSKREIDQYIKDNAGTQRTAASIEKYFADNVLSSISTQKTNELIARLAGLVNGDGSIVLADKQRFLATANISQLAAFLSTLYLFAVSRQNKHKTSPMPVAVSSDSVISLSNGRLFLNGNEVALPDKLTPPDELATHEEVYIAELLRAYAEAEGKKTIDQNTMQQKYKDNLNRQRQDFFNAEAVSRRVRDIDPKAVQEFDVFKQDTYDGIIDTCEQSHANGYERLLKVLQQAANRPEGKSLLEKLPKWIGSSEKKGACHILVNEKRIKWVVTND